MTCPIPFRLDGQSPCFCRSTIKARSPLRGRSASACPSNSFPLAIVQLVANGFILEYGWPQEILGVTSGAGAAILVGIIITHAIRRPSKSKLVGAYRQAQVPAP